MTRDEATETIAEIFKKLQRDLAYTAPELWSEKFAIAEVSIKHVIKQVES